MANIALYKGYRLTNSATRPNLIAMTILGDYCSKYMLTKYPVLYQISCKNQLHLRVALRKQSFWISGKLFSIWFCNSFSSFLIIFYQAILRKSSAHLSTLYLTAFCLLPSVIYLHGFFAWSMQSERENPMMVNYKICWSNMWTYCGNKGKEA